MWNLRGLVTLLACLVVVGLVRLQTLDDIPRMHEIAADGSGTVTAEQFTVVMVEAKAGDTVEWVSGNRQKSEHVFVVVRALLEPHGQTLLPQAALRTRDGHLYTAVTEVAGEVTSVPVGFRSEASFVFMLPRDQAGEMVFLLRNRSYSPINIVSPTARFPIQMAPQAGVVVERPATMEVA